MCKKCINDGNFLEDKNVYRVTLKPMIERSDVNHSESLDKLLALARELSEKVDTMRNESPKDSDINKQ